MAPLIGSMSIQEWFYCVTSRNENNFPKFRFQEPARLALLRIKNVAWPPQFHIVPRVHANGLILFTLSVVVRDSSHHHWLKVLFVVVAAPFRASEWTHPREHTPIPVRASASKSRRREWKWVFIVLHNQISPYHPRSHTFVIATQLLREWMLPGWLSIAWRQWQSRRSARSFPLFVGGWHKVSLNPQ